MRNLLLASTCLACIASPLRAETKIETKLTSPVRTATAKDGAADDIRITLAGSVTPTGPVAVAIDSNNKVINEGTIQITNVSNAVGIEAAAGVTSSITNIGKIIVDETYAPTDIDKDGDLDGVFAIGSGRFGIRTNGDFTGNITNSGSIAVEGNDSAGIKLGGTLNGNLVHDGTTTITGDRSIGIDAGAVKGNVRLAGSVVAIGAGAVGTRLGGAIDGALVVQGSIVTSGYRYTTPPLDPSKLDADDLLQGGSALVIEDSVAKGIVLAVPPKDGNPTDKDEDKDGIDDAKEGAASVTSYGAAPAMVISAAGKAITVGSVEGTGTGFGLIVDGNILGSGLYTGIDGNGLVVGGQGGTVAIAKGIGVNGTIKAVSLDKTATAIRLGAGASTPELRNAGSIIAISGKTATSTANAIVIDIGASLGIIRNSGVISAKVDHADGAATAIVDRSGTVSLIENSGVISAAGAKSDSDRNVAIDVSANAGPVVIRQTAVAVGIAPPAIVGDIRFGGGNDLLDIADGGLSGKVLFGAGDNRFLLSGDAVAKGAVTFGAGSDSVTLGGTSSLTGAIDFGGGADTLTIGGTSNFTGALTNAAGLAVTVNGGTFGVVKANSIGSLTVSNNGVLKVTLDKAAGASSLLNVGGAANFGEGSKLQLAVSNIAQAEGHFTVIKAGSLVGADKLTASTELLPFLYSGKLTVTGNEVSVDVTRKSADQLGLNSSEAAAFGAIYAALGKDEKVGGAFLGIRDEESFIGTLRQMLPDHAGGTFEAMTMGDRTIARMLTDSKAPFKEQGKLAYWVGQVAWGSSKSIADTAGYKVGGWGVTGGADVHTKVGKFGASLNYLWGRDRDRGSANEIGVNQYALAAHWRLNAGQFRATARAGYSRAKFEGTRQFNSDAGGDLVERTMDAKWNGSMVSGIATVAHESWAGSISFKPSASVEYYNLKEDGYAEKGGGAALDLIVEDRESDELAVNGLMTVGLELGGYQANDGYLRLEVEGGRRQIVGGELGATTAHFAGGEDFTLNPEDRQSGWLGRLRGIGGNSAYQVSGELGAEEREKRLGLTARASFKIGL